VSWALSDLERRVQSGLRVGTVTAVDASAARARVSLGGEAESAWLPWLAERAATISVWAPVAVGEQVLVASPGGDTAQGIIVGSLFSGANGPASADGAAHVLALGGSTVTVTADAVTIDSNGSSITLDASGIRLAGARIDLN